MANLVERQTATARRTTRRYRDSYGRKYDSIKVGFTSARNGYEPVNVDRSGDFPRASIARPPSDLPLIAILTSLEAPRSFPMPERSLKRLFARVTLDTTTGNSPLAAL